MHRTQGASRAVGSERLLRYLDLMQATVVYSLWGWMLLFGAFVLGVTLQMGHLPVYGQPDPKDAGALSALSVPTVAGLSWVTISIPIGVVLTAVMLWKQPRRQRTLRRALLFALGLVVFYVVASNDLAGLLTWLAD